MHIHAFLHAIHPWLTYPGFLVLLLASFAASCLLVDRYFLRVSAENTLLFKTLRWFAVTLLLGAALIELVLAANYPFFPAYIDWVEPGAADISWLSLQGRPMYPSVIDGELYAQVYGPLLFEITGFLFRFIDPTIALSKLPALGAFTLGQILSYLILRRSGGARIEALSIVAAQCVILAGFTDQAVAFGIRADPWVYLIAVACTLVATFRPSLLNAAIFGVLAGAAADLKIHAVLYVAPFAIFALGNQLPSVRVRMAIIGSVMFIVAFVVPFRSLSNLADYIEILEINSGRSLDRWLFEQNILMILFLFLPITWVCIFNKVQISRQFVVFLASILVCMLIILIPASMDGAGPYHYLPFLPALAWGFLTLLLSRRKSSSLAASIDPQSDLSTSLLIIVTIIGYFPILAQSWENTLLDYSSAPMLLRSIGEIEATLDAHRGQRVALAPIGQGITNVEGLRVLPVFQGSPLPIDPVTWADDGKISAVRDALARNILRDCRIDLLLLPQGTVLAFDSTVLEEFHADYRLIKTDELFEHWQCGESQLPLK